jgi:hypothetical protein
MNRVEEMKSAKEYTRRSEAQGKIMQQWRRDNPKIRNAHTERRRQEMTEIWSGQLEQKEEEQRQKETQREVEKQRYSMFLDSLFFERAVDVEWWIVIYFF